jgi:pimeloyl-ACP methyl ester carboxylesterase
VVAECGDVPVIWPVLSAIKAIASGAAASRLSATRQSAAFQPEFLKDDRHATESDIQSGRKSDGNHYGRWAPRELGRPPDVHAGACNLQCAGTGMTVVTLNRDGVNLTVLDEGDRSSADVLLLLHGWCCDSSTFSAQAMHFGGHRRIVIPDLRGHGTSDAPVQQYDLDMFVDDIVWQLDELDIVRATVVGHSMGGAVGLELGRRYPKRIAGLLMIDTVLFPPPDLRLGLAGLLNVIETSGLEAGLAQAAALLFIPQDDPTRRGEIISRMAQTSDHVALSAFRNHLLGYDPVPALSRSRLPLGYVGAANPLADLGQVLVHCPKLLTAQTLASGHFSPVFVPDQINAMIETFLRAAGVGR